MPVITAQPPPFGRLQREKHIEQLFLSLRRGGRRGSQEPQNSLGEEAGQGDSGTLEPEAQSSIPRVLKPAGATESSEQSLALLVDEEQLCITARPGLQGLACEPGRTYSITTASGNQLYVVVEDTSCLCLLSCGPARSCSLRGYNREMQEVFLFERPLRADACCLGCCLMEMQAFTPDHQLIGTVRQKWSMFTPLMELSDSDGTSYIRIQGRCCPCRCYSTQEFQVVSKIGDKLGKIWKKWPGFNEDYNMDHEYFGLDVPSEMSLKTKVLLLAAAFLLNYMFFEMS
ncbi:phospholipid scramblase family member 5 [Polyodon spathula]|uniref:phospholipid scramblase family member 5 n=1 Tax=Polyodon spathula TaxID=7913 RepID=UPI001B7DE5AC|nr:phospholipid scramblase family member 5 [Polyodon spathula]